MMNLNLEKLKNGITYYYNYYYFYFLDNYLFTYYNYTRDTIINWYYIIRHDIYETDNFKNSVINYYNIFKIEYLGNGPLIQNIERTIIKFYNAMLCNYIDGNENYNKDLKKYREEVVFPISFLVISFIVYQSKTLTWLLSSFYNYIFTCILILIPILVHKIVIRWKKMEEMVRMAKVINKKTRILQTFGDRISFLFLGSNNILWDYGFEYEEIERRYNEVNNGRLVDTQRMNSVQYYVYGIYADLVGNYSNLISDISEKLPNFSQIGQQYFAFTFRQLTNAINNAQRRIQ